MRYSQEFVDCGTDRVGIQVYPEPPNADVVAIILPAMKVPATFYSPFAEKLVAAGIAVAVMDLRGYGASTPAPSRASQYGCADLAGDVGTVLAALEGRRRGRRTVLIGHCFGGQIGTLHLALDTDSDVAGLALIGAGLPYWRDFPRGIRLAALVYGQTILAVTSVLGFWPGWTIGGRQSRKVITDSAFAARWGRFRPMDGVDVEAALAEMTIPVLGIVLNKDLIVPSRASDRMLAKMTRCVVIREHYTAEQAGGSFNHFTWVRRAWPLATRVAAWANALPARPNASAKRP